MRDPEISTEIKAELDPLPWRMRIAFRSMSFFERIHERKARAESLRQAREYEKKAADQTSANRVEASNLQVSAGRAYINAGRPNDAVRNFEEAQPELEAYMKTGVSDGFICLAGLYLSLEHAYRTTGDEEKAVTIHQKAVELAVAREEHFGTHTKFLSGGDVLSGSSITLGGPAT